jgi:hypothetical protein
VLRQTFALRCEIRTNMHSSKYRVIPHCRTSSQREEMVSARDSPYQMLLQVRIAHVPTNISTPSRLAQALQLLTCILDGYELY